MKKKTEKWKKKREKCAKKRDEMRKKNRESERKGGVWLRGKTHTYRGNTYYGLHVNTVWRTVQNITKIFGRQKKLSKKSVHFRPEQTHCEARDHR